MKIIYEKNGWYEYEIPYGLFTIRVYGKDEVCYCGNCDLYTHLPWEFEGEIYDNPFCNLTGDWLMWYDGPLCNEKCKEKFK